MKAWHLLLTKSSAHGADVNTTNRGQTAAGCIAHAARPFAVGVDQQIWSAWICSQMTTKNSIGVTKSVQTAGCSVAPCVPDIANT